MGAELKCRARVDGKKAEGRALLETSEVIFRGDGVRARLPFAALKTVVAADGVLTLAGKDGGELVLELGPAAATWAEKIRHPKSRLDKLGVKPGMKVSVIAVDDPDLRAELAARGADASFAPKPRAGSALIFFGATRTAELARLATLRASLDPAGGIWVIRPKGVTSITEKDVLAAAPKAGLVDVKVVAFSPTHTAEKLVIPVARRPR
jgi:hypothetical protein